MKTSTHLKALIRNLSKTKNVEAEVILRSYMMERLLERIAVSKYRHNFILKGGVLIASIVGIDTRTTMDLDATIKGVSLTVPEITSMMNKILSIPIDDNIQVTLKRIDEIREEADYPGFSVSFEAVLEQTRQILKVDITSGDSVTPREIEYSYPLMFENRSISLMAYNPETVLAEKLETIISRGIINTRMRDYYDIHILLASQPFDKNVFKSAFMKTAEKRGTLSQMENLDKIIRWQQYRRQYSYAIDISWSMVIDAIKQLAEIVQN